MTLIELYNTNGGYKRYGQDKFGHHYAEVYDILFAHLQDKPVKVFEVGFFMGGSCRLWLDYFKEGTVKCIDVNPRINDEELGNHLEDPRFELEIKDSNEVTADYIKAFDPDIFIDDGSHVLADQLYIVNTVYPALKPGALLIIEDVQDIDNQKAEFEKLGFPFVVADMRPEGINRQVAPDSVLIIYRKI